MSAIVPVITGPPRPASQPGGCAVCIGVFDGVHRGHRWMIAQGRAAADQLGLPLVVLTFDPHPLQVVRPQSAPRALASLTQRTRLLADAGADEIRIITFDRTASLLPPADFADEYLVGDLGARRVVVGENFRFGYRAAGDTSMLAVLGADGGFDVERVGLHTDADGEIWSSSRIRALVAAGDMVGAAHGLRRWHRVEGVVEPGDRRGRELGYPTANVDVPRRSCRPADGVYAGWLVVDPYGAAPDRLPAAISVGANRTFDGVEHRVEAHVLDRTDLHLYGKYVAVDFLQRLRAMIAFDSAAELLAAMAADIDAARNLTSAAGAAPAG